jgi:hypothetical protein
MIQSHQDRLSSWSAWSMRPFAPVPSLFSEQRYDRKPPWDTHIVAICKHEKTTARLREYEGGVRARRQCEICWQGVGNIVSKSGVTEKWDHELERFFYDQFQESIKKWNSDRDEHFANSRKRSNSEWWRVYSAYLRSPHWALKRELVLERSGGVCECCLQRDAVEVHHEKYPRSPMQWGQEPLWWLRAVCRECHGVFHPHMGREDAIMRLCE